MKHIWCHFRVKDNLVTLVYLVVSLRSRLKYALRNGCAEQPAARSKRAEYQCWLGRVIITGSLSTSLSLLRTPHNGPDKSEALALGHLAELADDSHSADSTHLIIFQYGHGLCGIQNTGTSCLETLLLGSQHTFSGHYSSRIADPRQNSVRTLESSSGPPLRLLRCHRRGRKGAAGETESNPASLPCQPTD